MMWATNDPDVIFEFATSRRPAQTRQARRIKALAGLSAVILPVAVALYLALPANPLAALAAGLLWGLGFSTVVGLLIRR